MRILFSILGAAGFLAAALPVDAAVTVFTDRTTFEAAASGPLFTEDFESEPIQTPLAPNTTHQLGSIQFEYSGASTGPSIPALISGSFDGSQRSLSSGVTGPTSGGGTIAPGPNHFTLPNLATAFGADFRSTTTGDLLTLTVAGVTIEFDQYLTGNGDGFLGIISDVAFTELEFGVEDTTFFAETYTVDNVTYNSLSSPAVPEPTTLALLSLGGIGLMAGKLRKSRMAEVGG